MQHRQNPQDKHRENLTKIVRGTGVNFAGRVLGGGLNYLCTVVAAWILGATSFGYFMLGLTIVSQVGIFSRLGLEGGAIRYISIYIGTGDRGRAKGTVVDSIRYSIVAGTISGAVLFAASGGFFDRLYGMDGLDTVIRYLALTLPFLAVMAVSLASTQGFHTMKYTVYGQNLFMPAVQLSLMTLLYLAGLRLSGVIAGYLASVVLSAGISVFFLLKTFPDIGAVKKVSEKRELFQYSIALMPVFFFNSLILWTDTMMLGHYRSSADVGVYSAAAKTAMFSGVILASFNSIFAPMIADLYNRGEHEKLAGLFKTVTKWIFTLSLSLFFLLALLPGEIMSIFGSDFAAGSWSLVILAAAQLINSGTGTVGILLAMTGRQNIMLYNAVGICVLNIFLNYLLIPVYGMIGAAAASAASIVTLNIVMLLQVKILLNMQPYNRGFIRVIFIGAVAYGVVGLLEYLPLDLSGPGRIAVYTPLYLSTLAAMFYCTGLDDEDVMIINEFKQRLLRNLKWRRSNADESHSSRH